jgi:F0F1-type ATP synthase assembly protein I
MSNPNGRDNELDQLLKPLKAASPNDLQMQKWKSAVQANTRKRERTYSASRTKWAFQLAAAMFVGVLIGAFAFKNNKPTIQQSQSVVQISMEDATIERSHDNLD